VRRTVVALVVVTLGVALAVGTAGAKPHDTTPLSISVTGTFTPSLGGEVVLFAGTLTAGRFVETDGQLALEGTLATDAGGPFGPLAITVVAVASPSADAATGECTVAIGTTSTLVERGFLLFLEGASFELGDAEATRDVCSVLKSVDKDPADQGALASALNKTFGLS
jgi:hypothetical protein